MPAAIAAFGSRPTASILTLIAAVLTVGAVLVTKELLSAARLLRRMALVAIGREASRSDHKRSVTVTR